MESIPCYLLSYVKYGDHDAVLHCFTKEMGYQSYFARGIYAAKNKKKAYLLPLNELELFLSKSSPQKTIQNISRIELLHNRSIYTDVKANAMIFFAADFLNQILKLENQNPAVYEEIGHFLDQVEQRNYRSHLFFLYNLLELNGFLPLTSAERFLNPENGQFEPEISHPYFSAEISDLWKSIAAEPEPYSVKMNASLRAAFQDSVLLYYRYHFTDFREPKSLEILKQIFE